MLLKIYLAKFVIYNGGSPWLPLITGLPSLWVVFALIEWLAPRRKFGVYVAANLVMTCIYFAVIMYYKYFGVIVTYHALQQVGQVTEVRGSVFSLLHPYFLLIFIDNAAFLILMAFSRRFRQWSKKFAVREPKKVAVAVFALSLVACLAIVWQNRDSVNELKQAEQMGILNYEAYAVYASSKDSAVDAKDVTPEAVAKAKGIKEPAAPAYMGTAKGKNLIVIQVEALQKFLLNTEIDGVELTPNLNKLVKESLYFPHFYQMVGQGNTADAEFVVNTSFLIPPYGAASQDYGGLKLPSMPRVLAANGYETATFHTNDVKFWNRNELYKALGFGRYYDKEYFGDDDLVFFGSSDEVLYRKTSDKLLEMSESGKPFYAQLITMSSHHPFNIPEGKVKLQLPDRFQGTLVGDYITAQNYADYALGQFIARLKETGLWDKSVIVLYGDHMGLPIYSLDGHERDLMQEICGREYRFTEMMNIPLLMSVPSMEPQVLTQLGGQADIFPTVANLLGISLKDHIHFGQDLLNQPSNLLPQRYYLPSGSFVYDKGIFVPGENFRDGTKYPFDGASAASSDVTEDQYRRALQLLRMSDSYVNSLPKHD
ncbi:LTA synthase family protein [Cohnella pontilimi]|uniref:LTA synthase family protein n=2 Tax=Cohnella pontilimi TaxID=2564100 RepID=A0A4U0F9T2_9BACL|nr:LTA synthase family protein [Cohnella pontilimi]TJY40864.1 LTA synthase family protein [Cohnella pontilimi]